MGKANPATKKGEDKWCDKILELMDIVDTYIDLPERETDKPFLLAVEDVFSISGRGTVATGRVEQGIVKKGDDVEILGRGKKPQKSVVTGIRMFNTDLPEGPAGYTVGVLVRGIERSSILRGRRHLDAYEVQGEHLPVQEGRGREVQPHHAG